MDNLFTNYPPAPVPSKMSANKHSFKSFIDKRDNHCIEFISQKFCQLRQQHEKAIDKIIELQDQNHQIEIKKNMMY